MGISTRQMGTDLRACVIVKSEDISRSHTGTFTSLPANHTGCLMISFHLFLLIGSLTNSFLFSPRFSYYRWGSTCHSIFLYFPGLPFSFVKHFQSPSKVSSTVPFKHEFVLLQNRTSTEKSSRVCTDFITNNKSKISQDWVHMHEQKRAFLINIF